MLRLAAASLAGTAVEFYDFFVYGTAAALVLGPLFFPTFSPVAGTLAAFGTFGVGFVARPLGSVLFGHIGDRRGRRPVLIASLVLTGTATVAVGCLPTYGAIGTAAPVLLLVLRFGRTRAAHPGLDGRGPAQPRVLRTTAGDPPGAGAGAGVGTDSRMRRWGTTIVARCVPATD